MKTSPLLLIIFILPFLSFAQEDQAIVESPTQKLETCFEKGSMAGIAMGMIEGDGEMTTKGMGYSHESDKTPFKATTKTRIASIAKPMTAIGIMQLYEDGLLDLDAPIQNYLPDYPEKKEGTITIRHLLTHTSGTPAYASKKEVLNKRSYADLEEAMAVFEGRKLVDKPGNSYRYTTYGYVVLGRIIEVVSQQSYEDYMIENIWNVAGMDNTGIEYYDYDDPEVSGTFSRKNDLPQEDLPIDLSNRTPGGGLQSTVEDILKFGQAVYEYKLLSKETFDEMLEDVGLRKDGNGYGLGWYLYGENPKLGNVIGHSGSQQGCSALFFVFPDRKASLVVLSNTSDNMKEVSDLAISLFENID